MLSGTLLVDSKKSEPLTSLGTWKARQSYFDLDDKLSPLASLSMGLNHSEEYYFAVNQVYHNLDAVANLHHFLHALMDLNAPLQV